jgi:hypothetical protein
MSQAEGGVDVVEGSEGEWIVGKEVDGRRDNRLYRCR